MAQDQVFSLEVSSAGAAYVKEAAKRFSVSESLVFQVLFSVGSIHKEEAEERLNQLRAEHAV